MSDLLAFVVDLAGTEHVLGDDLARAVLAQTGLVAAAIALATAIGLPLGMLAATGRGTAGYAVQAMESALVALPPLALLALLAIPFSDAPVTVGVAFTAASALPAITRGVARSRRALPPPLREAARSLALPLWFRVWHVDLPLRASAFARSIRRAMLAAIAASTLASLADAPGCGDIILRGIADGRREDILFGCGAVAALTVIASALGTLIEWMVTPAMLVTETADRRATMS